MVSGISSHHTQRCAWKSLRSPVTSPRLIHTCRPHAEALGHSSHGVPSVRETVGKDPGEDLGGARVGTLPRGHRRFGRRRRGGRRKRSIRNGDDQSGLIRWNVAASRSAGVNSHIGSDGATGSTRGARARHRLLRFDPGTNQVPGDRRYCHEGGNGASAPTRQHSIAPPGSARPGLALYRRRGVDSRASSGFVCEQRSHHVREEGLQRLVVTLIDIRNSEDTYLAGVLGPALADERFLFLLHYADHVGPLNVVCRDLVSLRISLRAGGTHLVVAPAPNPPGEKAEDVLRDTAATQVPATDE
jgi:hypothetical protein